MKKILAISAGIFYSAMVVSQPIQNSGFESWSIKNLFSEPNGFNSSNLSAYMSGGSPNVKKVADAYHGIFAAKLETIFTGTETIPGMLVIGTPGNQAIAGGIPYSGTPDSVSGYIKKNIQPGDTANLIVFFKRQGIVTGIAHARFSGIASGYQRFAVPVSYTGGTPDSIAMAISSSNMDPPYYPGSSITIDSISFIGAAQSFPNGSFESWKAINTEEPNNWATLNYISVSTGQYSATKSTDSYDGTYSIHLEGVLSPSNDTVCSITNGKFRENKPSGGMDVSANPQKITGFYKYLPSGPDTGLAWVITTYYDEVKGATVKLDSSLVHLVPAAAYTFFEIPLSYKSTPVADTMSLTFSSCNIKENSTYKGLGSVLLIDKLNTTYFSFVGIENNHFKNSGITVFPNPAAGELTISGLPGQNNTLEIYNNLGEIVLRQTVIDGQKIITLNIPNGIYLYKILTRNNRVQTGKITIEK